MRRWRHLPLRRPAPGGLAAVRGPQRCHIVAVRTVTMSHRGGCGAVTGAAAARREGPPGPARRERAAGACAAGGVRAEPPPGRPALGFDPGFIAFRLARPSRTLPCRHIDLTVKTGHTVLTKSIYLNTESHNLS